MRRAAVPEMGAPCPWVHALCCHPQYICPLLPPGCKVLLGACTLLPLPNTCVPCSPLGAEFFWVQTADSLQALYASMCDYLELDARVEVLNERFGVMTVR